MKVTPHNQVASFKPDTANQSANQSPIGRWLAPQGALGPKAYQFIFVKELDERGGDIGVEPLQEGVYLGLDGACHPQLCHQLDVLGLWSQTPRQRE